MSKRTIIWNSRAWCAALAGLLVCDGLTAQETPEQKQQKLITLLRSGAPPAEKALVCKQLAVYGTPEAVPALAPLLADPELSSWSRIALEAIPGPAADTALRNALDKVNGRLLVGVINSIGVRRDAKAVGALTKKLNDPEAQVTAAAAVALGRIGGPRAAKSLERALPGSVTPFVAEGCVLCAERFYTEGKSAEAVRLYDIVRSAKVQQQQILEATRGAILARGSRGLPLLLAQLRSPDKALFGIGLRVARELPGQEVTEALALEMDTCPPNRQPYVLLALSDRSDPAVFLTLVNCARNGSPQVRLVAVTALDRLGNRSSLPVLLQAATDPDRKLAQAALNALGRLPGNEVDGDILNRLSNPPPNTSAKTRAALIKLAEQRRLDAALPTFLRYAEDSDEEVRAAALQALGALGKGTQAAELALLLPRTKDSKQRADIEMALISIAGRAGPSCVNKLLPLALDSDSGVRAIAIHVLASAGGAEALAAVKSAVQDSDVTVQDEAVRALSNWPNNWPEDEGVAEPLLQLAKSGKKESHQALGLRGYLQYLQGSKKLGNDEKVAKVNELLPLLQRPDQKRLAIAAIDGIPTTAAIQILVSFAAEPDLAEDASSALIALADKHKANLSKDQRQQALQTAAEKSKNDRTRKKAEDLLKRI